MSRARPGLRFVVPVVAGLRDAIEPLRKQHAPDAAITLLDGRAHEALAACDVALVASGTATLEAALFKRPMVVVYVMHVLSWQMGKLMHYQPWVSLPNILLRDHAVPGAAAGRRDAGEDRRRRIQVARRSRRGRVAARRASRQSTARCSATPARSPPRRSKPSSRPDSRHARHAPSCAPPSCAASSTSPA